MPTVLKAQTRSATQVRKQLNNLRSDLAYLGELPPLPPWKCPVEEKAGMIDYRFGVSECDQDRVIQTEWLCSCHEVLSWGPPFLTICVPHHFS